MYATLICLRTRKLETRQQQSFIRSKLRTSRRFSQSDQSSSELDVDPFSETQPNPTGEKAVISRPNLTQPNAYIDPIQVQLFGWLGSRVVSVLDSGAEGPGFKSQPRRYRVTILRKLFSLSCLCSPSSEISSSSLKGCEGNCRPGRK